MGFTVLERLFATERYRQRAGSKAGFSTPVIQELQLPEHALPLLASNMRNSFLSTRVSAHGQARYGFSSCTVDEEPALLGELYRVLFQLSVREKWSNRCSSPRQAIAHMRTQGLEPQFLVISESLLRGVCGQDDLEEARKRMAVQGSVATVEGIQVLLSGLPAGVALVTAAPPVVGVYTRVGDHLGILAQRVNRSIVMVSDEVA